MKLLRLIDEHDENERDWQLALHGKQRDRSPVSLPAGSMTFHEFAAREATRGA